MGTLLEGDEYQSIAVHTLCSEYNIHVYHRIESIHVHVHVVIKFGYSKFSDSETRHKLQSFHLSA